jgi:type IV pilus assembly protein PilV
MAGVCGHRSDGFALTEVLVAAAVLAVGLLGHAALLVSALQTERDAAQRATAATLTASMAERIRSNSSAGAAYALDPDAAAPLPLPTCELSIPSDAAARAACDLAEWRDEVSSALPGADASLVVTSAVGSEALRYTLSVRWVSPGVADRDALTLQVQVLR